MPGGEALTVTLRSPRASAGDPLLEPERSAQVAAEGSNPFIKARRDRMKSCSYDHNRRMSHPRTQLQRVGGPDTEDNDRVRHPQTGNDRNQKDKDKTASWKRRDRPWFALLEFALSVEVPRGIADERDSADRTVTPTGNKTKMNGFVEISTLLIHSAPKQKCNEWMHLSPFYTRMHGEWLRYAKSTSQFHWRFLLVRDVRGFQVNPLCRHDITRSDRQIGNWTKEDRKLQRTN